MRRYETRSTMMTSNRPLEDWGKLIGDVPSATAILDRFLHHAEIITITGKSYRLRNKTETATAEPDADSKPAKMHAGKTARTRAAKSSSSEPRTKSKPSRLANHNATQRTIHQSPRPVLNMHAQWPVLKCTVTA